MLALLFVGYTGGSDTGGSAIEDYMNTRYAQEGGGGGGGGGGNVSQAEGNLIPGSRVKVLRSREEWHAFLVEALDPNPAVVYFTAKVCGK